MSFSLELCCLYIFLVYVMVNFTIKLADINVGITSFYKATKEFCSEYLSNDRSDFNITISKNDIESQQSKSYNYYPKNRFSGEYLETLAVYRKIAEKMPGYNTLLMHGSVIAVDGTAYMFTAKSGTGKSTHTKLWREVFRDRAVMVNDDKPLIKITDSSVIAYGTPWNGKHHLGSNISAELKAVCILSRAEQNHIEPISKAAAWQYLFMQTYRPADISAAEKTLYLIDNLANSVKLYSLGCNMQLSAALTAYNGINKE